MYLFLENLVTEVSNSEKSVLVEYTFRITTMSVPKEIQAQNLFFFLYGVIFLYGVTTYFLLNY